MWLVILSGPEAWERYKRGVAASVDLCQRSRCLRARYRATAALCRLVSCSREETTALGLSINMSIKSYWTSGSGMDFLASFKPPELGVGSS